jgi:light-regulated signal transduction histidine kinase (bacteriophytochrome)
MGHLIDDLLKLAQTSRQVLNLDTVNLSGLAQEIVLQMQASEPRRQVLITIAPDIIVDGDRGLLRVVLENLLNNAWKFTTKQENGCIELGVQRHPSESVYFVRDNGAGFNMKYANKLFGPFQRLHDQKEFPGTGVGLATVERIIHRHGGRIWAESEIGQGATFYFVLKKGG